MPEGGERAIVPEAGLELSDEQAAFLNLTAFVLEKSVQFGLIKLSPDEAVNEVGLLQLIKRVDSNMNLFLIDPESNRAVTQFLSTAIENKGRAPGLKDFPSFGRSTILVKKSADEDQRTVNLVIRV